MGIITKIEQQKEMMIELIFMWMINFYCYI